MIDPQQNQKRSQQFQNRDNFTRNKSDEQGLHNELKRMKVETKVLNDLNQRLSREL